MVSPFHASAVALASPCGRTATASRTDKIVTGRGAGRQCTFVTELAQTEARNLLMIDIVGGLG